jgi:hypothetical protein
MAEEPITTTAPTPVAAPDDLTADDWQTQIFIGQLGRMGTIAELKKYQEETAARIAKDKAAFAKPPVEPVAERGVPRVMPAPLPASKLDRIDAIYGSNDPVIHRGAATVNEAYTDPTSPLYKSLHTPSSPDRLEALDRLAAAAQDQYRDHPNSGLWDTQRPWTSQADQIEAHQRAEAEHASRPREFPPDYEPPVIRRPSGDLALAQDDHALIHRLSAGLGITLEVTDMRIRALLSDVDKKTSFATEGELIGMWGNPESPRYQAATANCRRGREILLKACTSAAQRQRVEQWVTVQFKDGEVVSGPTAMMHAFLEELGASPATRGRGREHGHT